jgi:UDP-N-acetylglucosamine 2-epimerase (non-hydrolysing)
MVCAAGAPVHKVAIIFGTRPEAIKLAPVILAFQRQANFRAVVCTTAQQRQMPEQVLQFFGIKPDYDLDLMQEDQTLAQFSSRAIFALDAFLRDVDPDMVIAQGDTTTLLCASLVAFYHRKPLGYVEAGLRTGNLFAPWPEEANRILASRLATLHFAPTPRAAENLAREGVSPDAVFVTGNTGIDALLLARDRIDDHDRRQACSLLPPTVANGKMVLITAHRRESFGPAFDSICHAIAELATKRPDVAFLYPAHLNPNVQGPVERILRPAAASLNNLKILPPVSYSQFIALMNRATLILTDSGGIQEEAPSLGKPVLVMRETTERPEAVACGTARLVGTDSSSIVRCTLELLENDESYRAMTRIKNPFGDGHAAERIVHRCREYLDPRSPPHT